MYNLIAVLLLATVSHSNVSVSLAAPVNPALVQRRDAIAASLTPSAKLKLHNLATSFGNSPASITDGASRAAIASAFQGVSFSEGDISALVFIVMMDATESAREDLKSIMANVAAINKQKEALRQQLGASANRPPRIRKVQASASAATLTIPPPLRPNATVAEKQDRFDTLSDMSQDMQMKIQMYEDRMTKAEAVASNAAKKMNDTTSSIIKNMK